MKNEELVVLTTEDSSTEFLIQKKLLIDTSDWFEKALQDNFVEGQQGRLIFPDTDELTLTNFVYWLFHRTMMPWNWRLPGSTNDDYGVQFKLWERLSVRSWAFADRHFLPEVSLLSDGSKRSWSC